MIYPAQKMTTTNDDLKKMLVSVANGQSAMKQELLKEIKELRDQLTEHKIETREGFEQVNKRIDILGKQLAYLEDDTPTREEHDELVARVEKVENAVATV